jgi:hypothetical protein
VGGDALGRDEGAGASEEERAMAIIMRTPEGKMWAAEERRDRAAAGARDRAAWKEHSVLKHVGGGRFNNSNSKSVFDWVRARAPS